MHPRTRTALIAPSRCALLFLVAAASPLFAQTAPRPPATEEEKKPETQLMEAFMVTGSNIRRLDEEKVLPVTVFDLEDLALRAAPTAADLFETLSIGGPITLDEGNTLGADARGDNVAINLRGIGSGNTLVLLNGRRLPRHPISMTEGSVPSLSYNVNNLPAAAIGRVEVLRDGASAIYGTDAAAGVVNSITRSRFDGTSIRARGSVTEHGGGNDWNVELTHGRNFNRNRSNLLVTFDYYHRDFLWLHERKFSRNQDVRLTRNVPPPWDGRPVQLANGTFAAVDNDFDNRLSTDSSFYGGFVRGNYDRTGAFVGARPTGNRGIITTSGSTSATMATNGTFYLIPLVDGNIGWRQTLPSHNLDDFTVNWYINPNDYRPILPESNRHNLTAMLRHKLQDDLELFAEVLAYGAYSKTGRYPTSFDVATDHNIYVSADNPFNPFGTRFYHPTGAPNADGTPRLVGDPAQVSLLSGVGVIPRDFKPRRITVRSEAYRFVTGLRGRLGGDWEWESGVLYGRNKTRDEEEFAVRESRLRAALTTSDPAKAFNPFNYVFRLVPQASATNPYLLVIDRPYSNPEALTNSLYDNFVREGRTQLASWDLRVNGTAYDRFWGGPIGIAFGGEVRWEDYRDFRPPYSGRNPADAPWNGNPNDPTNLFFGPNENDFLALSPNVNLYSSRSILSAFGELALPFVGKGNRMRFARSLELTLAGRAERFSDFGRTAKPKVGVSYRPNEWILFRASSAGSFRAPNLVQNNPTPLQRSGDTYNDIYRSEVTGLNRDSSAVPVIFRQGNSALKPENSKSFTAGIALSAPFYRGLTVTVDYWRIDQKDVISAATIASQITYDEELLDGATQRALAAGTPVSQIDLGSGSDDYVGNPKVKRDAVTPADIAAYNAFNAGRPAAQQRAPVGQLRSVVTDYVNLSGREVEGLDFGIELRLPATRLGQGTIRGDAAYLLKSDTQADAGAPWITNINRDGRTRFRGDIGLTWRKDRWMAGWYTTYYGTYVDTGTATTQEIYEALGRPEYISTYVDSGGVRRYRYLVSAYAVHNAYLNYALPRRRGSLLSDLSLRLGVSNAFDNEPPLADEDAGYRRGAGTSAKGRTWYSQISKRF